MRLLLVRHGESVDNVANLYAGSRDSALTAHGVLQARRLGSHLAAKTAVTHVFSSDLQRAYLTAAAIVEAQDPRRQEREEEEEEERDKVIVVQSVDLRERDFRSGEGKRVFGPESLSVMDEAETREEMRVRAERFVDGQLGPLLARQDATADTAVVIVSHGMFLNILLSSLMQRWAHPSEAAELSRLASAASARGRRPGQQRPSATVSWRNTGYLEMACTHVASKESSRGLAVSLSVVAVNSVEHLQGLKKTRGGIGSAAHDAKQKTMESFFGPAASKQPKN